MTLLYWLALYLTAKKATDDLDAFTKGSLPRDLMVFATIITAATILAPAVVLGR